MSYVDRAGGSGIGGGIEAEVVTADPPQHPDAAAALSAFVFAFAFVAMALLPPTSASNILGNN